jgi:hypothetical protein
MVIQHAKVGYYNVVLKDRSDMKRFLVIREPFIGFINAGQQDAAALWPILKVFAETGRLPEQDTGE